MKMKWIATLAVGAALLLTGCWQKSVHPFYTDKDVYAEPQLLGVWSNPKKDGEDTETWTFTKSDAGDNVYNLKVKDGKTNLDLDARVFKLGGVRLIDLHSRSRSINEIPAHHLLRIDRLDGSLQLKIMSVEWTQEYLTAHPKDLAHARVRDTENPNDRSKDEIVITATTEELQKFVLAHMKDDKFFDGGDDELKKVESK